MGANNRGTDLSLARSRFGFKTSRWASFRLGRLSCVIDEWNDKGHTAAAMFKGM